LAETSKDFKTPREVTDYFRQKRLRPGFSWVDVWAQEHAFAFTVAKAVDTELLGTFQKSLDDAITNGESFETWKKKVAADLTKIGWWGPRRVKDPTDIAEDSLVDFSRSRRLKTIFWSNMRSARAAGQWERVQRTKRALPFLLYVRSVASDPRPEHLVWAGTLLPVDDPFWNTHFPPNGWGCKCAVRQVSRFEANRLISDGGFTIDGEWVRIEKTAPQIETRTFKHKRRDIVEEVPVGIDPGWHTNPGLSRARTLIDRLNEELDAVGPDVARSRIRDLFAGRTPDVFAGIKERVHLPVAVAPQLQDVLEARTPLIVASTDTIQAKTSKHAVVSIDTFSIVQDMLDLGTIVDEGRSENQRAVYLKLGTEWWKLVIKRSADGFLRLHTIYQVDERRAVKWIERENGGGRT
jgi:hypothetical protein